MGEGNSRRMGTAPSNLIGDVVVSILENIGDPIENGRKVFLINLPDGAQFILRKDYGNKRKPEIYDNPPPTGEQIKIIAEHEMGSGYAIGIVPINEGGITWQG